MARFNEWDNNVKGFSLLNPIYWLTNYISSMLILLKSFEDYIDWIMKVGVRRHRYLSRNPEINLGKNKALILKIKTKSTTKTKIFFHCWRLARDRNQHFFSVTDKVHPCKNFLKPEKWKNMLYLRLFSYYYRLHEAEKNKIDFILQTFVRWTTFLWLLLQIVVN